MPWKPAADAPAIVPKTPEQLAAEYGLHLEFLKQWAKYLDRTKADSNSVFSAWHVFHAKTEGIEKLPSAPVSAMFRDFVADSRRHLAERYQKLFDQADQAWRELKQSEVGKTAEKLPDPAQEALRQVLYDPEGPFAIPKNIESYYSPQAVAELKRLREELQSLEKSAPVLPQAMGVTEGKVQDVAIHIRGNHLTLGDVVPRRFPRILAGEHQPAIDDKRSGRLQLADWLSRLDHPLTSRVMVNRLWRWHFGEGLVRSTDNFGRLGDRPTDPALLDWLARRFVESGWSIKAMHRLMMLSSTYQMSTAYNEQAALADPENRLHWRMNRRRLEAEAIRDCMLFVSGQLDLTMGGSLLKTKNREYVAGTASVNPENYESNRRSVYLPVVRSALYEVFQAFDFADPSTLNGERATTTVAPQALFMMNSDFVFEQSKHLAADLLAWQDVDDAGRIRLAYERAYGRPPSEHETARALEFVTRYEAALQSRAAAASASPSQAGRSPAEKPAQPADSADRRLRAWQGLCRVILAANEFIYVE